MARCSRSGWYCDTYRINPLDVIYIGDCYEIFTTNWNDSPEKPHLPVSPVAIAERTGEAT